MKKIQPNKETGLNYSHIHNISTRAQRERLLMALIEGPITTYYARENLNICAPAPRVKELREEGHDIYTSFETLPDNAGRLHPRSARYVLLALAREMQ